MYVTLQVITVMRNGGVLAGGRGACGDGPEEFACLFVRLGRDMVEVQTYRAAQVPCGHIAPARCTVSPLPRAVLSRDSFLSSSRSIAPTTLNVTFRLELPVRTQASRAAA